MFYNNAEKTDVFEALEAFQILHLVRYEEIQERLSYRARKDRLLVDVHMGYRAN